MTNTRICTRCNNTVGKEEACPTCTNEILHARPASEMTGEERVAEMNSWRGVLEVEFEVLHVRFSELVGRPVFTHEMGSGNKKALNAEAMGTKSHPQFLDETTTHLRQDIQFHHLDIRPTDTTSSEN